MYIYDSPYRYTYRLDSEVLYRVVNTGIPVYIPYRLTGTFTIYTGVTL